MKSLPFGQAVAVIRGLRIFLDLLSAIKLILRPHHCWRESESRSIFEYAGNDDQSESRSILGYAGYNQDEDDVSKHNIQIFNRLFFLEEDLRAGKIFNMKFVNNTKATVPLLPRQISKQIPFSEDKKKQVLAMLGVEANSSNAKIIAETIGLCQEPATEGERKHCATSLESMVDFVVSALGKNVGAFSTEKERETESGKFVVVKNGVRKLGDDKVIACHPMSYPYVVFGCHLVPRSSGYLVRLKGEDGVRVKAVVACHRDTSKWDHNHGAFKVLNLKPGNGTVCHVFTEGNLLWLPN